MPALVRSDFWGDGGSISAIVSDGGHHRSFLLQSNRWTHPRDAGHLHLFVSDGGQPEAMEHRIEISSPAECQWLDYLLEVDDTDAAPESKAVFRDLIQVLQARQVEA